MIQLPPAPTQAADLFPSMIFSAWDEAYRPSQRLMNIAIDAINAAAHRVDFSDLCARPNMPVHYLNTWPGDHYKLLAALVLTLQPKVVIEIGTFTGLSALSLKQHLPSDGCVTTFDLIPWPQIAGTVLRNDDFADGRLVQQIGNLADPAVFEQHRTLLESAELFFIDGPKDGVTEFQLMERFNTLRFRSPPLLVFDDTRLWSMLKFWRELPHPKLDLTSFGHWSGTGIVDWQPTF